MVFIDRIVECSATSLANVLPVVFAGRDASEYRCNSSTERTHPVLLAQSELKVGRTTFGAVLQLFGNHLIALQYQHRRLVIFFGYQNINSGYGVHIPVEQRREVLVMQHRFDTLILKRTLQNVCLHGVVARYQSNCFHGSIV